jgi:hypothetical protein
MRSIKAWDRMILSQRRAFDEAGLDVADVAVVGFGFHGAQLLDQLFGHGFRIRWQ